MRPIGDAAWGRVRQARTGLALAALLLMLVTAPVHGQDWKDPSPHQAGFIQADGARLHYLDWGGTGPLLVLLPGYLETAHIFDDLAPRLTGRFRVVAMTPRGFGESDAPPDSTGWTTRQAALDLGVLLDSLGADQATLAGHSLSGWTITHFALAHPERVSALIFLDSFLYYHQAGGDSMDRLSPVPIPLFQGPDTTLDAARTYLHTTIYGLWDDALEADLRARFFSSERELRSRLRRHYLRDARQAPPDLTQLHLPALEICAQPTLRTTFPWLPPGAPETGAASRYVSRQLLPFTRALCDRFAADVRGGETLMLTGPHWIFLSQADRVAQAIIRFAGG
jgi:pimeloyl-ACP methyl ester carboxylesterase